MDKIKENILHGYINKEETFKKLETTQDYIKNIVSGFNIRTKKYKNKIYYNLEDLENALIEVDNFHKEHYSLKHVVNNIMSKNNIINLGINSLTIPKHYANIKSSVYNSKSINTYYKKDDIENGLNALAEKNKVNEFVDKTTVLKMLEIDSKKFILKSFVEEFNIRTIKSGVSLLYNVNDVNQAILEISSFFSEHYFSTEAFKLINYKIIEDRNIEKIDIPKRYVGLLSKSFDSRNKTVAYKKNEIDKLIKEYKDKTIKRLEINKEKEEKSRVIDNYHALISTGEYISRKEALDRLSFNKNAHKVLSTLNKEGYIKHIFYKKANYYNVKNIDIIISKRNKFFNEFIVTGKANDIYFKEYGTTYESHKMKLKHYDIPLYCRGIADLGLSSNRKSLKISELIEYLENYKYNKRIRETKLIEGNSDFETFLLRLAEYPEWKNGFNKECIYTKEKFVDYVRKSLESDTSKKTRDEKIRLLIELGIIIKDMLERHNTNEIYYISDAEINLYMNTVRTETNKANLYRFLSVVNSDLRALGITSNLKFNFENIKKPKRTKSAEEWENAEKDLYDFETYAQVFNYVSNIDLHMPKIINELNKNQSILHASLWLYVILHLNNAWRNGDCNRFPELMIKDLIEDYEINDIYWFENNKLTLSQSKAIIFRVRQWEMRMSKTQLKGAFFCSDELSPAFATAVTILHLYKYQYNNVIDNSEESKLIMNFDNHYNEVTKNMLKTFFKPSGIKNFTFSSRKFNKSIMTYIYFLANLKGDNKALIYSSKLRSHMNLNSTSHYVDFSIDKVDSLSRQLFQRGEFGYIPALLSQKVLGESENGTFEDMTNQVMKINAVFGDINKMNTTAKFLNIIASEKQNVIDMISEKSFSECQELLTNIFTCDLPSKDGSDIQCLFSKQGCQMQYKEDDFSCFDCPYHIPSIYALTRLCNGLIDNYKEYLGLPKDIELNNFKQYLTDNPSTKSRLSIKSRMQVGLKIERRKVILREALNKYGGEYIYRCLGIDRQTFIELSNFVKLDFYETYPQLL